MGSVVGSSLETPWVLYGDRVHMLSVPAFTWNQCCVFDRLSNSMSSTLYADNLNPHLSPFSNAT